MIPTWIPWSRLLAMGDVEGYWGPPIAVVLAAFIIWLIIRKDLRDLKK